MAEKPVRHRYPLWMAWPPEIVATALVVLALGDCLQVGLAALFQLWPQSLVNLEALAPARTILETISWHPPGPFDPLVALLEVSARAFALFFLAALVRNLLPQLQVAEAGLRVRRGLGWALVPWDHITRVHTMALPGERLVLLIQGRRWRLGPWFRLYSLLWGAGLRKGLVINWHISEFDRLAETIALTLQEVYGEDLALVVNDSAYSFLYALLFLPGPTWGSLFARRQAEEYTYYHPRWVAALVQALSVVLLVLGLWRYFGVWWRFLDNRFPLLEQARGWPIVGILLSTFGARDADLSLNEGWIALLLAQVSMILLLGVATFLRNLCPDWMLVSVGPAVRFRRRWLEIPWAAIRAIRETIFSRGGGVILVQVRWPRLTLWHSLYSLFYGAGLGRGALFTSLLPDFQELREHIEVGVVRAHEAAEKQPSGPILVEHGEADFLLMLREPRATLRRWAGLAEEEESGATELLKKAGYVPPAEPDLPWEWNPEEQVRPKAAPRAEPTEAEKRQARERRQAFAAAAALAVWPILLVGLEEGLFPALSRPLAWFPLSAAALQQGPLRFALLLAVMGLLALVEWPFSAFLVGTVAETFGHSGEFRRAFLLYPRVLSPLVVLGPILLAIAATGVLQPLYLIWWGATTLWGGILLWLMGREVFGWHEVGNAFLLAGYILFQGMTLLVYLLLR